VRSLLPLLLLCACDRALPYQSNWQPEASGTGADLLAVSSSGGARVAAGTRDTVLFSTGNGWTATATGLGADWHGALALPDRVLLIGARAHAGGIVARSRDAGATWETVAVPTVPPLVAVWCAPPYVAIVGEGGTALVSTDGGETFTRQSTGASEDLLAIWGEIDTDGDDASADLIAAGTAGALLASTDAGATWRPLESGTRLDIDTLWGNGDGDLWFTASGTVWHSTGFDNPWQLTATLDDTLLSGAWGGAPGELVLVGGAGVWQTWNGAATFPHEQTPPFWGFAVSGDRQSITTVGRDGAILTLAR